MCLFSHPKDFTPVCTTELGLVARLQPKFDALHTKAIALSVDSLEDHKEWIKDINAIHTTTVIYPIIADHDREISFLYGMIHPHARETATTLTVRSVFIINPKNKVRLMLTYPASTGRNFDEIFQVISSLQLTDQHRVVTPANWKEGEDCVIDPNLTDEEADQRFGKGYKVVRPYLRLIPMPS